MSAEGEGVSPPPPRERAEEKRSGCQRFSIQKVFVKRLNNKYLIKLFWVTFPFIHFSYTFSLGIFSHEFLFYLIFGEIYVFSLFFLLFFLFSFLFPSSSRLHGAPDGRMHKTPHTIHREWLNGIFLLFVPFPSHLYVIR